MMDHRHSEGEEDLTLAERLSVKELRETIDKSFQYNNSQMGVWRSGSAFALQAKGRGFETRYLQNIVFFKTICLA